MFILGKMKREYGRRTGGDRRYFTYGIYIPERRKEERRKYDRRCAN